MAEAGGDGRNLHRRLDQDRRPREDSLFLDWVAGAFEKITGYTYEEYVARGGWLAALHPDDVAQDARDMQALRENRPVVSEVRTFARKGDVRWVRVYGHPVWDPDRNMLVGIYGAVQDVTDRKRVEAEREALIREREAKKAESSGSPTRSPTT